MLLMCGVAGWLRLREGDVPAHLVGPMLDRLRHRGPDERGTYADAHVALGHVRLSIVDLAGGGQPMANEDRTLWVVFNGEIFNFVELRAELQELGHRFATRSDTEVILHAYEEHGLDCLHSFNGQWAFALWDTRRRQLVLARDRLGVRPLFYWHGPDELGFASEIKALLVHPDVPRRFDPHGLIQALTLWTTLPPRTAFAGIRELPPGHLLVAEAGRMRLQSYWRPTFAPGPLAPDAPEQLDALLGDALRLRLRADVPVGAYLSGGLDSSLTTALARAQVPALSSFSVGFEDAAFDESDYQREVARFLDTDNHALTCAHADIGRVFPDVVWHAETPLPRTAPAPLFLLARHVRRHGCKVVITGEGADEVFGGYDIFKEAKVRRFWLRQPHSTWRPRLLARLYPYLPHLRAQPLRYLQAFFHVDGADPADVCLSHRPRWSIGAHLRLLLSDEMQSAIEGYDPCDELRSELPAEMSAWPPLCQAQYLEMRYLLPGYLLSSQGDRMALGHGVEGRFPFLDHRIVAFASRLPVRAKLRGLQEKPLLQALARGRIPERVRLRPKQPYRAPEASCFVGTRERPLRWDYIDDVLHATKVEAAGVFRAGAIERLLSRARHGQASSMREQMALVAAVSIQLLAHQFLGARAAARGEGNLL